MKDTQDATHVICPHCNHYHDNPAEWCLSSPQWANCNGCGQAFTCWAEYTVTYHAQAEDKHERK